MDTTVLRVLLAEDNPDDVRAFKSAFARRDDRAMLRLSMVHDGLSVVEFLRKSGEFASAERPDLLVLNLNMPRMQGWEVLRHMKGDPALRKIPVVIWTISEREDDIDLSFDLGAQGYFVKQVDAADMKAQVNAILTCFRWAYLNPCARH
jgi:two-component system response regulator